MPITAANWHRRGNCFSLRASEGTSPADMSLILDLKPLELQNNTFMLLQATEFVVICHSRNRKLIQVHIPPQSLGIWVASCRAGRSASEHTGHFWEVNTQEEKMGWGQGIEEKVSALMGSSPNSAINSGNLVCFVIQRKCNSLLNFFFENQAKYHNS